MMSQQYCGAGEWGLVIKDFHEYAQESPFEVVASAQMKKCWCPIQMPSYHFFFKYVFIDFRGRRIERWEHQ